MEHPTAEKLSPVLYLPHGGGPLPILGDERHESLVSFFQEIVSQKVTGLLWH